MAITLIQINKYKDTEALYVFFLIIMPMLTAALCYLEPPEQDWVSADTCSQSEITELSA